jgi:hypothetical protein
MWDGKWVICLGYALLLDYILVQDSYTVNWEKEKMKTAKNLNHNLLRIRSRDSVVDIATNYVLEVAP